MGVSVIAWAVATPWLAVSEGWHACYERVGGEGCGGGSEILKPSIRVEVATICSARSHRWPFSLRYTCPHTQYILIMDLGLVVQPAAANEALFQASIIPVSEVKVPYSPSPVLIILNGGIPAAQSLISRCSSDDVTTCTVDIDRNLAYTSYMQQVLDAVNPSLYVLLAPGICLFTLYGLQSYTSP